MYAKEKIHEEGRRSRKGIFVCDEIRMKRQKKYSSIRLFLEVTARSTKEEEEFASRAPRS